MLDNGYEQLKLPGADLLFYPDWLSAELANSLMKAALENIAWECHRIKIFGREVNSPRLSCWIGDAGASYVYSQTRFEPHAWLPELQAVRQRLQNEFDCQFNSVLANRYRNGADSMGWHSDSEPELGANPLIASVSLGAARRFCLRHKTSVEKAELLLTSGSLLVMAEGTQKNYQHALPKMVQVGAPRVNLTFRWIAPAI